MLLNMTGMLQISSRLCS